MQTASSVFKTMSVGGFTLSLKYHKNKEYGIGIPCICINGTEAEAQKWSHTRGQLFLNKGAKEI